MKNAQTDVEDSAEAARAQLPDSNAPSVPSPHAEELNGPGGPEPTRFGDWERNGRCVDF